MLRKFSMRREDEFWLACFVFHYSWMQYKNLAYSCNGIQNTDYHTQSTLDWNRIVLARNIKNKRSQCNLKIMKRHLYFQNCQLWLRPMYMLVAGKVYLRLQSFDFKAFPIPTDWFRKIINVSHLLVRSFTRNRKYLWQTYSTSTYKSKHFLNPTILNTHESNPSFK